MRLIWLVLLPLAFGAAAISAQTPGNDSTLSAAEEKAWAFTASAYHYILPEETDFLQTILAVDHGRLHLEARYNDEEIHTGSVWIGFNLRAGKTVTLELTPAIGGVFGNLSGGGLGFQGSLSWKALEFYGEGAYLLDAEQSSESYFYSWTQLIYTPAPWVNFGLLTQRTRFLDADRTLHRGPFLGFTWKALALTGFATDPGSDDGYWIIGLDVSF